MKRPICILLLLIPGCKPETNEQAIADKQQQAASGQQEAASNDLSSDSEAINEQNSSEQVSASEAEDKATEKSGEEASVEKKTKVHRLASSKRAVYDAFVHLNRIPEGAREGETPIDVAGNILGRIANQEGRVLLKLPSGMDRNSYLAFKTFFRYEGESQAGNCAACHAPAEFTDSKSHVVTQGGLPTKTPALRNLGKRKINLHKVIMDKIAASRLKRAGKADEIDDAYAAMNISKEDVPGLVALIKLLNDIPDADFRERILHAKVLDTTGDIE